MNKLSKTISALIISGILASAAFVAPAFAKDGYHGAKIERIAKKLTLSEAQTVSFTEVMKAQKEKRKALKKQDIPREEKRSQMQAIKTDTFESLQSILSEEQLAQFEKIMQRGKKEAKENTTS